MLHCSDNTDRHLQSSAELQAEIDAHDNIVLVESFTSLLQSDLFEQASIPPEQRSFTTVFCALQSWVVLNWDKTAVALPGSTCKRMNKLLKQAGVPSVQESVCVKNDDERMMWYGR